MQMANAEENVAFRETLRRIAEQRDTLLSEMESIPPARLAILSHRLSAEFPVEAAMSEMSDRRDQLLTHHQLAIPHSVSEALRCHVLSARRTQEAGSASSSLSWKSYLPRWTDFLQSPAVALAVAASLIIAAAVMFFGIGEFPFRVEAGGAVARGSSAKRLQSDFGPRIESTSGEPHGSQLSLRMNAAELARFREAFLATNHPYLAEVSEEPAGMRLDLPLRALLISDGVARIP